MSIPVYRVDSFTDETFKGNPACVCVLKKTASRDWMQKVAREMNVVRTAFVNEEHNGFRLHWFSPYQESGLCGHATLASAHILWAEGYLKPDEEGRLHTKIGLLKAVNKNDWIELDFPVLPVKPLEGQVSLSSDIRVFLGQVPRDSLRYIAKSSLAYLVEVESAKALRELKPDFTALSSIPGGKIILTASSDTEGTDFISRFFTQGVKGNEDQATGSAHCCLGPYWSNKLGKEEMIAYQASARGGVVRVKVDGNRVILGGKAVTVFKGQLLV
ncbi:PhzF family phenazine biosynthesis protein [candidate division WOR-3 bacterium]|nr:PhzF family phenazine biosynthesis protein [candidate division WOR-3 bacterium]